MLNGIGIYIMYSQRQILILVFHFTTKKFIYLFKIMAVASDGRMTYLNKNIISGVVFYFFTNTFYPFFNKKMF